jgi:MscS family membrane protein
VATGLLAVAVIAVGVRAQDNGAAVDPPAEKPPDEPKVVDDALDRGTPRRSIRGFLTATEEGDFFRASDYLDLRYLPRHLSTTGGALLAQQLDIVIARQLLIDFAGLSDEPEGILGDGLPANRDVLGWASPRRPSPGPTR